MGAARNTEPIIAVPTTKAEIGCLCLVSAQDDIISGSKDQSPLRRGIRKHRMRSVQYHRELSVQHERVKKHPDKEAQVT